MASNEFIDITETPEYRLRHVLAGLWLLVSLVAVMYLVGPVTGAREFNGLYDVLGIDLRGFMLTGATVLVLIFGAWSIIRVTRALGPVRDDASLDRSTAGIMAMMVVTLGVMFLHPLPWAYKEYGHPPSVISELLTIRAQLEIYQVQHNGNYPPQDELWSHMSNPTNMEGDLLSPADVSALPEGHVFGPYLRGSPRNRFSNGTLVRNDNIGSWWYDATTGEFKTVMRGHKISEFGISPNDVIAASTPWLDDFINPVAVENGLLVAAGKLLSVLVSLPVLCLVVWWPIRQRVRRRLRKVSNADDPYTARLHRFAVISMISFGCLMVFGLFSMFAGKDNAATACLFFGFTFIWSLGGVMHLLYHPHFHRAWTDGSTCAHCGYDLTGTRQAGRIECPECGGKLPDLDDLPAGRIHPPRHAHKHAPGNLRDHAA